MCLHSEKLQIKGSDSYIPVTLFTSLHIKPSHATDSETGQATQSSSFVLPVLAALQSLILLLL